MTGRPAPLPVAAPMYFYIQHRCISEDITVAGPVIADLMTSISTTDADFGGGAH